MYAKVFRQIYESSIAEDYETRHVFMDMMVLADSDGVVDMTQEAIARITNVPLEKIKAAILKLEAPDSRSRTPDYEGCRIIRIDDHRDWGWVIVNYSRFRSTATEEKRRELTRLRVRKLREKRSSKKEENNGGCNVGNALHSVTSPSPSPSSSALQVVGGLGEEGGVTETLPEKVPWEWVLKWLESVRKTGADYTEDETRRAWLACNANGWMWGRNPVTDWRSALESKIQDNRARKPQNGKLKSDAFKEYGTAEQSEARRIAELAELTKMNTQPRK